MKKETQWYIVSFLEEFENAYDTAKGVLSSADEHLTFTNKASDVELDTNIWFQAKDDEEAMKEAHNLSPQEVFTVYKVNRIGTEEGLEE